MEVYNLKYNPNYLYSNLLYEYRSRLEDKPSQTGLSVLRGKSARAKVITLKPVRENNLAGFFVNNHLVSAVKTFLAQRNANIERTYVHKLIFAIIEKQLRGKNTINSLTHDLDKLLLYTLGFSHSFVSKFHRKYSTHHTESKKHLNIYSMAYDNMASNPEFKQEKNMDLRTYFKSSSELQKVEGLGELLEKYNFGEDLNVKQIKNKIGKYKGLKGFAKLGRKMFKILLL